MQSTTSSTNSMFPLRHARKKFLLGADGKPVHPSTVHRWVRKGILAPDGSRVRLEVRYIGRTPMTSHAAIDRFFDALTAARLSEVLIEGEPVARLDSTARRLHKHGLLDGADAQ